MNEYNIDFFVSDRKINKDDRLNDIMKRYLIEIREKDPREFRYAYETFLYVHDFEIKINKTLNSWKRNHYTVFFNELKQLNSFKNNLLDKTFVYLNKFFTYCKDKHIGLYLHCNEVLIAADIAFENTSPIITFNDFNVIIKYLKEHDIGKDSTCYYVALFSLLYYGISIYDMHNYTYKDFNNGKYLYDTIKDDYILNCISKSKTITSFKNVYEIELDSSNRDVICKPYLYKSRNQCMQFYRKRLNEGLGVFRYIYSLSPKTINKSGAYTFFTKECIERGLDLNTDLMMKRMETDKRQLYNDIAKKYRLDFSNVKSRYRDWILKIYNEELIKQN